MPRLAVTLGLLLLVVPGLACSSDDPAVERRGGEPLPPETAGEWCTVGLGEPVPFCEVDTVLKAKCQLCHSNPTQNSAPVPFVTYEDTQVPYNEKGVFYPEMMLKAIETDFMPFLAFNDEPFNIMPPAEPLTAEEKATLLAWLRQCAPLNGAAECP